jgi:hypothetical protein
MTSEQLYSELRPFIESRHPTAHTATKALEKILGETVISASFDEDSAAANMRSVKRALSKILNDAKAMGTFRDKRKEEPRVVAGSDHKPKVS